MISGKGIYPSPKKLKSTENLPIPETLKEVKQVLGLTGYFIVFTDYYHTFITTDLQNSSVYMNNSM